MAEVFKEPQSEAEKKQDVEELREKFAELRERFSDALYERQLAENAERNFKGKKILADGSPTQEYTDLVRKYTECKELVESLKPELNALGSVIEIEELKEKKIRRERDGLVSEGYVEFDVNGGKAKILLGKYEKGNEVFFRVDEITEGRKYGIEQPFIILPDKPETWHGWVKQAILQNVFTIKGEFGKYSRDRFRDIRLVDIYNAIPENSEYNKQQIIRN